MTLESSTHTHENPDTGADAHDRKGRFEAFQARAKAEWNVAETKARAELLALPTKLKTGATQAWSRLRDGLDLPRRGELAALAGRIDELAQKLADYEAQLAPRSKKVAAPKD
jgi:hypothetical protein